MIDLTLLVERSERRRTTKPIKTRELSDAQLWIPLSSFVYSIFDIGSEDWWITGSGTYPNPWMPWRNLFKGSST